MGFKQKRNGFWIPVFTGMTATNRAFFKNLRCYGGMKMPTKRFAPVVFLAAVFIICAYVVPVLADLSWKSCDWKDASGNTHHVQCAQAWVEVTDTNRDCTLNPGFDCVPGSTQTYRLNTFVYLPCDDHTGGCAGKRFPAIQQRTPYGIGSTAMDARRLDPSKGALARSSALLRGWRAITDRGYACVLQDTRGRYGSEGADHVYGDDDRDGAVLVDWIAGQWWSDGNVGASGSSAGSITAYAAASGKHSGALKAIFAQAGGASIPNGVVYEGQSIELERLMLWVSGNIVGPPPAGIVGLSDFSFLGVSGKGQVQLLEQFGAPPDLKGDLKYIQTLGAVLKAAESPTSPTSFVSSPEWMTLPLLNYPSNCGQQGSPICNTNPPRGHTALPAQPPGLRPYFTEWQPYLNELMSHPSKDAFRDYRDFYARVDIPVLHSGSWYDIFANSTIRAFMDLQNSNRGIAKGNQQLWVGPGDHYSVYWNSKRERFYPTDGGFDPKVESDPYFEWFDFWLKGKDTAKSEIMERPPIYYSPIDYYPQYDYSAAKCYPEDPSGARDCYWANCETHRASDPNIVCKPGWNWRYADQWPFPEVREQIFYLGDNKKLSPDLPKKDLDFLGYTYDPFNPVPTFGGRNLSIGKGPADQTPARKNRTDVLTYSGDVLTEEIPIAGNVKVVLYASSNRDDTDFVVKLIDYDPATNKANLVQDSIIRAAYRNSPTTPAPLVQGVVYSFTIDLGEVLHVFPAGHIIQIDVTSSNFPRRARNPNNYAALAAKGGSVAAASIGDVRSADNRIYHDRPHPSRLILPIYRPWATAFTGDLQVTRPTELAFNGKADLYAFPTGIYLRFGPAADGKWHWRKWAATEYRDSGDVRQYEGTGRLGTLRATIQLKRGQYEAQAEGEGIKFQNGTKLY
jgi:predicted acyl esterase